MPRQAVALRVPSTYDTFYLRGGEDETIRVDFHSADISPTEINHEMLPVKIILNFFEKAPTLRRRKRGPYRHLLTQGCALRIILRGRHGTSYSSALKLENNTETPKADSLDKCINRCAIQPASLRAALPQYSNASAERHISRGNISDLIRKYLWHFIKTLCKTTCTPVTCYSHSPPKSDLLL